MHQKWDQARVIDRLRARYGGGQPLHVWKEDYGLYAAACCQFGSWRAALAAAGLPLPTKWTRERVLAIIRHRHQQQMPLTGEWRDDPRLYQAAIVHFGSWTDALRAAELPREPRWTRERVIAALQERYAQRRSMKNVRDDDWWLYYHAKKAFGNWRTAIQAAGLTPPKAHRGTRPGPSWRKQGAKRKGRHGASRRGAVKRPRPRERWSQQRVIAAIEDRYQRGVLSRVWKEEQTLVRAGVRWFGSWRKALEAAGLATQSPGVWSKDDAVQALRRWHHLGISNIRSADPALAQAAVKLFGSMDSALEEARLPVAKDRWTKRRVLESIQEGCRRGLPAGRSGFGDQRLGRAARRYFGDWHTAVAVARLCNGLEEAEDRESAQPETAEWPIQRDRVRRGA
jgi:hypothetical protein